MQGWKVSFWYVQIEKLKSVQQNFVVNIFCHCGSIVYFFKNSYFILKICHGKSFKMRSLYLNFSLGIHKNACAAKFCWTDFRQAQRHFQYRDIDFANQDGTILKNTIWDLVVQFKNYIKVFPSSKFFLEDVTKLKKKHFVRFSHFYLWSSNFFNSSINFLNVDFVFLLFWFLGRGLSRGLLLNLKI